MRWCAYRSSLLVLLLASCSTGITREDPRAEGYRLGRLPSTWQTTQDKSGADHSYINTQSGGVMAVNSVCKRYQGSSLDTLMRELTRPLKNAEVIESEERMIDGRSALYTRLRGRLDGVPVESLLVVYRKGDCVFDFTLFSARRLDPRDHRDFVQFVNEFRYQPNSERVPGGGGK